MTLHATNPSDKSETATIRLNAVWQLVPADQEALGKRPSDRSSEKSQTQHRAERVPASPIKSQCFRVKARQYCP
jgi:hypothetical protein